MSENLTPAKCTDEEYRLARGAGILVVTTPDEIAIHNFAGAIREQERTAAHAATLEQRKQVLATMLADNGINVKSKKARELAYAFFYGAYNGQVPAGVQILLMLGRMDALLPAAGAA